MISALNPERQYGLAIGQIEACTETEQVDSLIFYIENGDYEISIKQKLMQLAYFKIRAIKRLNLFKASFVKAQDGYYLKAVNEDKPHVFTSKHQAAWQSILLGIHAIPTIVVSKSDAFHFVKINEATEHGQELINPRIS